MERAIIHLNIADFAVAVETNLAPALAGYPLILAPLGAPRAVVYDMSEEAFQQGIRKGMPLARAKRLNRKIKILPPRFNCYEKVMQALIKETTAFTPLIESGTSDGHLYLDVTGSSRLFGPSVDVAFRLKKTFKKSFSLDPVWSVATNKLVAKVATRMVKPSGEYIVPPGEEADFLAPLPIHLIPGLETSEIRILHEFNLEKVCQARALSREQLKIPFSFRAPLIYERIRGIDAEPVSSFSQGLSKGRNPVPVQADHEFENDTNDLEQIKKGLYLACEAVGRSLRLQNLAAGALAMMLSYSDGVQHDGRLKINPPASGSMDLFRQSRNLLDKTWTRRTRIRHLRMTAGALRPDHTQADLFGDPSKHARQDGLAQAMERIRKKFGHQAIRPGLTLAREAAVS